MNTTRYVKFTRKERNHGNNRRCGYAVKYTLQKKKRYINFNPSNKPWFLRVCSTSLWKTLWEKEKLLVTSNFSFSHRVFNPFGKLAAIFIKFEIIVCKVFEIGRVENLSFGKGLKGVYILLGITV